jgi:O-antigen ligase
MPEVSGMRGAETFRVMRRRTNLVALTGAWCASGVCLYVLTPLLSPVLLALAVIAPVAWCLVDTGRLPWRQMSSLTLILVLAGIYLGFNASWSLSPSSAHMALGMYFLLLMVTHLITKTLPDNDVDVLRAMSIGLMTGMLVAGTVMFIEIFSLQWISRTLMSLAPPLRPKARDMLVDGGWVTFLASYLVNRNIAALTFLFWPTLLAIAIVAQPRQRPYWLAGLVPVVAAIFGSKHATSKMAFAGAAVVFVGFAVWPGATRRAVAWGWVATIMLVAPLAALAYRGELYTASWLPRSAQHRVVIWGYTSQLLGKSPLLGAGIDAARANNDADSYDAPFAPDSDFRVSTGHHSHNIYLQTWYEMGAVGAALLLAIGLLLLNALARTPGDAQPFLYASFVTCALLGGSSFSLWQPWFMASFGLVAGFAMVSAVLADANSRQLGVDAFMD